MNPANHPQNNGKPSTKRQLDKRWIIAVSFLLMGIVTAWVCVWQPLNGVRRSADWKPVKAVILDSRVYVSEARSHTSSHSRSTLNYSIRINYEYTFDNVRYRSSLYDFFRSQYRYLIYGKAAMKQIVARHPAGSTVVCLVNPDDPDEAVISREIYWPSLLAGIIPLLLFLFSGALFVELLRKTSRGKT